MSNSGGCYFSTKNISITTRDLYGECHTPEIVTGSGRLKVVFCVAVPQPAIVCLKQHIQGSARLFLPEVICHFGGEGRYLSAPAVLFDVLYLTRHIAGLCSGTPGIGKHMYC